MTATFVVPSDRELVRRADAIVVGAALTSYARIADGRIETVTPFAVHEIIKGSVLGFTINIHEPGGRVGDQVTFIPGVPRFDPGEESILFLTRTPKDTWAVTDIVLGHFVMVMDQTGQRLAIRDEGEIHGWDPDGGEHRERWRAADGFLAFLRAEAHGFNGKDDYFVSIHPLAVMPNALQPRANATFSATSYTSDIESCPLPTSPIPPCGSGRGARWNVFPTPRVLYTEPGTTAAALAATNAGISAWDSDLNSNANYQNGTDPCSPSCHTTGLAGPDGLNTVLFERDLTGYGAPPFSCSSGGTLGIGGITSASGTHTGPNGESFFTIGEVDVEMNQGVLGCATFPQGDLNSAVTHEEGHTLGFRHSDQTRANRQTVPCSTDTSLECSSNAIMKAFITSGLNAVLQVYDQHAVQAVYPCSLGGGCAVANDFNGDGKPDLLWRNYVTGQNSYWYMNGTDMQGSALLDSVRDPNWSLEGSADFNGDGKPDLVWRNYVTGQNTIWFMNGAVLDHYGAFDSVTDLNWHIEGIGDFNGDGHPDFLWRNYVTGQNSIWRLNNTTTLGYDLLPTVSDINWHIQAVGDFDGDGFLDIVWRHYKSGQNSYWYMTGVNLRSYGILASVTDLNWHIAGAGDYNGDGHTDLVWRNYLTGQDSTWNMNNTTVLSYGTIAPVDPVWKLGGRGPIPR